MRTHYCGSVDEQLIGKTVTLCGWADSRRDHGKVIFIDLRDHNGIVQVVVEPDQAEAFAGAEDVKYEYCLRVTGTVRARDAKLINPKMATGRVEIFADQVEVLNAAQPLPFMLRAWCFSGSRRRAE